MRLTRTVKKLEKTMQVYNLIIKKMNLFYKVFQSLLSIQLIVAIDQGLDREKKYKNSANNCVKLHILKWMHI